MNKIALAVKLAVNAENMDLGRISNPTARDYARIEEYTTFRTNGNGPRQKDVTR